MMITCSSTLEISLHESLYHPQTSMSWSSTSDECKECYPEKLNKESMKRKLKTLRHTRKIPLHADRRRQLGGEPPVHSRSVVNIFYNRDIVSR
jgi:hypothetical protein